MSDQSRALIWTDPANLSSPTDRRFLDRLGGPVNVVRDLVWTTCFPGGDLEATANLYAPPNFNHIALTPGRRAAITCGGAIRWHGTLDEPVRGDPWQLHFTGDSALSSQYAAGSFAYGVPGSPVNPNAFFDDAVGRGLPWTRNAVSLGPPAGVSTNTAQSFDDALAAYSRATSMFWTLVPSRTGGAALMLPFAPAPTKPSLILESTQPLNPTMQGYFTQVVVSFNTSITLFGQPPLVFITTVTVSDQPSIDRFGVREGSLDLTSQDVASIAAATAAGQAWLAQNKPQLRYTSPITVQPGQLSIPGGGPVDLMTVRAGCVVSIVDVDPSHDSMTAPGPLNMLVGTTSFDTTSEQLTLTPLGALGQDFESIVYQTAGGAL